MPPVAKPFPRNIADAPQEGIAYGRFEQKLRDAFVEACRPHESEAGPLDPESIRWFPDRSWGGRTYVPATARSAEADADGVHPEFYGHVSFVRPEEGDLLDVAATADFTDVTAEDNPDWKIDINDDVIGRWRSETGRGGDVTLIWGLPMVRGALAATAEIDGEEMDQTAITAGRFTLIAVDAIKGFGDPHYLDVAVWDRRLRELARESLYVVEDDEDSAAVDPAADGG